MQTTQTPNGFELDTRGKEFAVDPVTRIEGHMRCEVNVDEKQHHPATRCPPARCGEDWK
ncbi:MAG: hypothetical protein R3F17_13415 [Planctomycetota bacterium]